MSALDGLGPCPAPAGTDAQVVADRITAEARTSFAAGMRVLSRPRREAMHAIYAFARIVDDVADSQAPEAEKRDLLGAWREEVGRVYHGEPISAVGQALAPAAARFDLPQQEFLLLIEGMEMDAGPPVVAPPLARLLSYTRRVAGAVGMLSMRVFGAWNGAQAERAALRLGDAFQLTNILRDVEEDAARGRLYLPLEALEDAGVPADPAAALGHPGLARACAQVGRLARNDFIAARGAMAGLGRVSLAPALLMTGVYEGYLSRMEARGFRREAGPVTMSRPEKLARGLICLAGPISRPRPRM